MFMSNISVGAGDVGAGARVGTALFYAYGYVSKKLCGSGALTLVDTGSNQVEN
jgi:hypothetical protein